MSMSMPAFCCLATRQPFVSLRASASVAGRPPRSPPSALAAARPSRPLHNSLTKRTMVGLEVAHANNVQNGASLKASKTSGAVEGLQLRATVDPELELILTPDALAFVARLARKFTVRVEELLERRRQTQAQFDAGVLPNFPPETSSVRSGDWKVASLPSDLLDRRVEITGPTDRKMVINALNSGANVYMPDFEDSNSPTWDNMVRGQLNLYDAVRRTIAYADPRTCKQYALADKPATLIIRPRGWHLWEKHVVVDGAFVPGALFDFGLFFFHNARELLGRGSGPYFYLPKMQHYLEARLWNDVFLEAQAALGLPAGTIKATCLIETLPASFQMDEIIYELRQHMAGLNCGRWDYMFSFIKTMRTDPGRIMPDRSVLSMEMPFMRAYTQLVVKTCHRRGAFAIGGMSAAIPIKTGAAANEVVMNRVRADKLREVRDGHDGTWVAHPALIPVAKAVFDEHMRGPNQLGVQRDDVSVTQEDLLKVPDGVRTLETLRDNLYVCIRYTEAWLAGNGCIPLNNLMEDAATAEISRAQAWQWTKYGATLDDGQVVTPALVRSIVDDCLAGLRAELGPERYAAGEYLDAGFLTKLMCVEQQLQDFLTLPAYDILVARGL